MLFAAFVLGLAASAALIDPATLAPRFSVAPSMAALLPATGPARDTFERAQRLFGDDDIALVAWFAPDVFTPLRLAAWKRLTGALEALPGVARVESLASATDVRSSGEQTAIDAFLREVPGDAASAAAARERALANPLLRGRLVGVDGNALLLAVRFDPALDVRALRERVERIRAVSAAEATGADALVSGPLIVRLEMSRMLTDDLVRVMPLAVLATFVVSAAAFRSLAGVVLPLFANGLAAALTLAAFVQRGHELDFVTVILAPVVYVVGFAYAIHVLSAHAHQRAQGLDGAAAARAACKDVFAPLALTAVTTVAAFLALTTSELSSIRVFGGYAALGVALAWFASMTVVPAGLTVMRTPAPARPHARSRFGALVARAIGTHRRLVLCAAGAVAVVAVAGAQRVEVDTAVLHNFDADSDVRQGFARIAGAFAGPVPLRILIETDAPDGFRDPAQLRELRRLALWLEEQPEVGGVYSLADYVALLYRAIDPEGAAGQPLPSSARLVNHLLLLGGGPDLRHFVDASGRTALVHVRTAALSTAAVNDLSGRIEDRLAALPGELIGRVTGTSALTARSVEAVTRGQVTSLAVAFGVVLVVLSLAFGSLKIGLLALVPNVVPVAFYFGLLGYAGLTLNLTTSLVACAVFGIAIDDSVHFLARYGMERGRQASASRAVEATLGAVLRPVTVTTLALVAGFSALAASELRGQVEFGLLAAATLAFAWLVDVTFTPALCHGLDVRPVWMRRAR